MYRAAVTVAEAIFGGFMAILHGLLD